MNKHFVHFIIELLTFFLLIHKSSVHSNEMSLQFTFVLLMYFPVWCLLFDFIDMYTF